MNVKDKRDIFAVVCNSCYLYFFMIPLESLLLRPSLPPYFSRPDVSEDD